MPEHAEYSPYSLLAAPALGALVGGLGGAATAPEGRMARSITRGALTGAGTTTGAGLGMLPGFMLGYLSGGPVGGLGGAALGGLGGGALGNLAVKGLLGPAETDEEKLQRFLKMHAEGNKEKTAMDLIQFGAKVASDIVGMTYDPEHPNVKKLKREHPKNWQRVMAESQGLRAEQAEPIKRADYVDLHKAPKPEKKQLPDHEVFNNALMRAQAAGETPSAELFGKIQGEYEAKKKEKKAQSACTPCAMPNAPTNKKHMTSASPAVLDAGQKSEEIGKPETVETEHAEAKPKLPEEGAKSAYAFGRKVAAFGLGVTPTIGHERAPVYGDPPPVARPEPTPEKDGHPGLLAMLFPHPENAAVKERARSGLLANLPNLPVGALAANADQESGAGLPAIRWKSPERSRYAYGTGPSSASAQGAPYASAPKPAEKPTTGQATGQGGKPGWKATDSQAAKDVVNAALGPVPEGAGGSAGKSIHPGWLAAGGLGAAGLGALLYHLASQPKKKKRDEEEA